MSERARRAASRSAMSPYSQRSGFRDVAAELRTPVELAPRPARSLARAGHDRELQATASGNSPRVRRTVIESPLTRMDPVPKDTPVFRGGDGMELPVLIGELSGGGFIHERTVNPLFDGRYLVVMRKR